MPAAANGGSCAAAREKAAATVQERAAAEALAEADRAFMLAVEKRRKANKEAKKAVSAAKKLAEREAEVNQSIDSSVAASTLEASWVEVSNEITKARAEEEAKLMCSRRRACV
eukprot:CAMPEP_0172622416 /NCGR_PEP_ID=MMETSP1068-20121228/120255_1 /TAXON_ID=35684 /ORGANISM="Pseudopedinella elastica, Strain CCMP716" /LENGTH=112 /DNA_ID=CAMNT_0013430567 /DNA_START=282 /DNA_END=616 /DNA_ORIENTATION=+